MLIIAYMSIPYKEMVIKLRAAMNHNDMPFLFLLFIVWESYALHECSTKRPRKRFGSI